VATNKGTFLNIDFEDGVVVPLPTKTAMRLFWSVDTKFAETPDLIEELFNTCRGAIDKVACPVTVYALAVLQTLRHAFKYILRQRTLLLSSWQSASSQLRPLADGACRSFCRFSAKNGLTL
jgi:hypothetical protein